MSDAIKKAQVLIEALPYFQAFDEKLVVVKLGGNAMNESSVCDDTFEDIVFMEQVGIKPILIHGGGPYISKRCADRNVGTQFIDGLRVTDQATLEVVDEVYHEINDEICRSIESRGGKAASIFGAQDGIFVAKKKSLESKPHIDLGFVGEILSVHALMIIELTKKGIVPVISPTAKGKDGQIYNVNADSAAAKLAEEIQSEKLVFMSNIAGLLSNPDDPESLLSSLTPSQVKGLIKDGVISGGMLPKVEAAMHTLACGVNKVHLIDGRKHHSLLLEIFTNQGIGTQFVQEPK